jgi:hypothetical protein
VVGRFVLSEPSLRVLGDTGPTVTRTFRFLIHFLVDFPYHEDRQHHGLDHIFRELTRETKSLQNDIELLDPQESSPLLDSLQRYSSSLCAIWDLWEVLPMTPGDLGVMIPGDEARRPRFQKIANVAEKISEWAADRPVSTTFERPEQHYVPSADGCWGSEAVDASTIRLGFTF